MAIRIRDVDGVTVALCAARSVPKEGDVYLDDNIHYALTVKFMADLAPAFGCDDLYVYPQGVVAGAYLGRRFCRYKKSHLIVYLPTHIHKKSFRCFSCQSPTAYMFDIYTVAETGEALVFADFYCFIAS